jgi:lysophospholipase L1-like esterase
MPADRRFPRRPRGLVDDGVTMGAPLPARSRRLLLVVVGVLVVAALVVVGVLVWPGGSSSRSSAAPTGTAPSASPSSTGDAPGTYLALGDSVPFGFRMADSAHFPQPASFTGYPELLAPELGLKLLNASCPGETTASFSTTTAPAFGCENSPQSALFGYRSVYPLHVPYKLPESQLDYAVSTLKATKDVRLVTLQVGANDAFLCRQRTADQCLSEAGTTVSTAQSNVEGILAALRDRAGYTGRIVVVTYYSLDYSPAGAAGTHLLDDALATAARAHGAAVADGFAAFEPAATAAGGSSVAAGLVIRGDVHPTAKGQRLLAAAVRSAIGG